MQTENWSDDRGEWTMRVDETGQVLMEKQEIRRNLGLGIERHVIERRGDTFVECPETGRLLVRGQTIRWWSKLGRSQGKKIDLLATYDAFLASRGEVLEVEVVEPVLVKHAERVERVGYTTIDWRAFAYDDGEVRGISMRSMVEAGLYARMEVAVRTLHTSGLNFHTIQRESTGGRPSADYILSLADARRFASRARTEVGRRILDTILEHHEEFQTLLEGDHAEAERIAERVAEHRRDARLDSGDPLERAQAMLDAARRARDERRMIVEEQEQQREEIAEIKAQLVRGPGDVTAATIASEFGLFSRSGRPHAQAVISMARSWQFEQAGLMRTVHVPAEGRTSTETHPMHVFNLRGALRFRELLEDTYGSDAFEHVTAARTYHVERRGGRQ